MTTNRTIGFALAIALWGLAVRTPAAAPLFHDPVESAEEPWNLAQGDFNGDGREDFAVPGFDGQRLRILLGRGDGTFDLELVLDTPFTTAAAIGDFDEDGDQDVVTSHGGSTVSVLLGNGDGSFGAEVEYTAGEFIFTAVVGDLDKDDHQDLVVGFVNTTQAANYSILFGNGDGTFGAPSYFANGNGRAAAIADVDGDTNPDVVVTAAPGRLRVYLGDGNGGFAHDPVTGNLAVGGDPVGLVLADLDGDGDQDLAAANSSSNDVSVVLGNGDGTFAAETRYPVGLNPLGLVVADIDADGESDLVIGNSFEERASVLFGRGDGTFDPQVWIPVVHGVGPLASGDYNDDGRVDLAVASTFLDTFSVLLGNGDGTFPPPRARSFAYPSAGLTGFAYADVDEDGEEDAILASDPSGPTGTPGSAVVLFGDGLGGFPSSSTFAAGPDPTGIAVGDLDGDDNLDLVVTNAGSNDASVLLGHGDGTFDAEFRVPLNLAPRGALLADFDDDGVLDLAALNPAPINAVLILFGDGDGTFTNGGIRGVGQDPAFVTLADLDGNGLEDLVTVNSGSADLSVLIGQAGGVFAPEVRLPVAGFPRFVLAADLDGDGDQDLAHDGAEETVVVLPGNGDGTFGTETSIPVPGLDPRVFALGDLDGDRLADLAVGNGTAVASWLRGDGAGGFSAPRHFATASWARGIAIDDLDGDGRSDLVVATTARLSVLINQGPTVFTILGDKMTLIWPEVGGALSYNVYRGSVSELIDGDANGLPDLGHGVCLTALDADPTDRTFVDVELPAAGDGFFYLRSVVDWEGERDLGTTSSGIPRVPTTPCP